MKIILCQISNRVINPETTKIRSSAQRMYDAQWQYKEAYGYYKPHHFWELPLWIGELTYALNGRLDIEVGLHVIDDLNAPLPEADKYCFSVLDVNKEIVRSYPRWYANKSFYLGGYINREYFEGDDNVYWFDSIELLCKHLDIPYKYGVDWSLFRGIKCIPRLTMSYGCSHRCKFCTVPNKVTAVPWDHIEQQVYAMRDLKFKLVYLNDKTWGMCDSHYNLMEVRRIIESFNPDFEGFIVQTSVAMIRSLQNSLDLTQQLNELDLMKTQKIKIIELGVETINDGLLRKYNKPQCVGQINSVVKMLSEAGFNVIANIMLGLPGETLNTYYKTLGWIYTNYEHLFGLNVYTLALYEGSKLSKEIESNSVQDSNELSEIRTFWTQEERIAFRKVKDKFYNVGETLWKKNSNGK